MKYAMVIGYRSARETAELAREVEQAGWDGIFVGDAIWMEDPLICLAAAAMTTTRIRLGTMVLAMPLRRPWHLASESLALDHLSGGRLILGLGAGAVWMGWQAFPDVPTDARTRGEMLDESVDLLTLFYQRQPFDFDGKHYHLKLTQLDVMHYPSKPVQQPRIPLWVVGIWPRKKSMRRILKCDGLIPMQMNEARQIVELTPEGLKPMKEYLTAHGPQGKQYDIPVEGKTGGLDRAQTRDKLQPWVEAGATWWVESTWDLSSEQLLERIRQGPPLAA